MKMKPNRIYEFYSKALTSITVRINNTKEKTKYSIIYLLAVLCNIFGGKLNILPPESFQIKKDEDILINCLGITYDPFDLAGYEEDLKRVSPLLERAHVSFTELRNMRFKDVNREQSLQESRSFLREKGILAVGDDSFISGQMLQGDGCRIGVITYKRFRRAAKGRHISVDLMRYILALKRQHADYIIVYVSNRYRKKNTVSARERRLHKFLCKMGADYVVGLTPNILSGGSTFLSGHRKITRSVSSLGIFLSEKGGSFPARAMLHLRLRRVQGKVQLIQESYTPLYKKPDEPLMDLLKSETVSSPEREKCIGWIERSMLRIRPADRMITLGQLLDAIELNMPEEYAYMADFSVGKICARTFEASPGDIFFFRQAFDDPNDLVKVSHSRRVRAVKRAYRRGAFFMVSFCKLPIPCPCTYTDDVMEAHMRACAYLRRQFDFPSIAITGSIGKTSTKDMLAEVVKMQFNTVKSESNTNSQVKIAMNLQHLTRDVGMYIQECGGGRPGGASRHSRMVCPSLTIVTNIGDAHLGNFNGDHHLLMANKLQIADGMPADGILYLNGDDPLLWGVKPPCSVVYYAVENHEADYYVENIREGFLDTTFQIVHGNERTDVQINVLGEYNVLNAVCAFAVGEHLGIPRDKIVEGLANFSTSGVRQNIVKTCHRTFYMDCFNSSPASVRSSLTVLQHLPIPEDNNRIAILGDMTGLGDFSDQAHAELGDDILQNYASVDCYLFFGEQMHITFDKVKGRHPNAFYAETREKLNRLMEENIAVNDAVLLKGSSKTLLEQSVDMVYGTRMTDQRLLDEAEFKRVNHQGSVFNVFGSYATLIHGPKRRKTVHIPAKVSGMRVVNIGVAFTNSQVESVHIPPSIRHISSGCFKNCTRLSEINMPRDLRFIGAHAFEGCIRLQKVDLPNGLLQIGEEAFKKCEQMKTLYIPSTVVHIGGNAFSECGNLTILCKENSYAANWLAQHNIPFQFL